MCNLGTTFKSRNTRKDEHSTQRQIFKELEADRQIQRETETQRQTDRQADRQTDRDTERELRERERENGFLEKAVGQCHLW